MNLEGPPSDGLAEVLATGRTDARFGFLSLSTREPGGRDADYIEWHSLDHRPEQYRLAGTRNAQRLVSTPACRAVRAANLAPFDRVDHVMIYQFADADALPAFGLLGEILNRVGRMPLRLPHVGYLTGDLAGTAAAPRVVAGADVIPWRPALGVYVLIEAGQAPTADLAEIPGVAGVWWYQGARSEPPFEADCRGRQITLCYLDGDPVEAGTRLGDACRARWSSGSVHGLFAGPFFTITPFEWARHLPD